jgi:8-oxo-dGTP pyrophosphatase MutT (NUDIX family)
MALKRIDVVATVIYCKGKVLLVHNNKWNALTLPMTKLKSRASGRVRRWERGADAAMRTVREALAVVPDREPGLLLDAGGVRQSNRSGQVGYYHFQIYCFPARAQKDAEPGNYQWLTPKDILADKSLSPTVELLIDRLMEASLERKFPPLPAGTRRTSTASIAIIRGGSDKRPVWLCQWNKNWRRYFLVGGHAERGEKPEACMRRELQEELKLGPDDYRMSLREPPPTQPLTYTAWSTGAWRTSSYEISCFDVALTRSGLAKVKRNSANRWLTCNEVRNERTDDDKLVSPTTRMLLVDKLQECDE